MALMTVYHGTSMKNLPGILKNGLVPRKRKNHEESSDHVFVEESPSTARAWATQAGGYEFVVLEIEIREESLRRDRRTLSDSSFYVDRISKRAIKGWDIYRTNFRTGEIEYDRHERNPAYSAT